jgi:hypothetical protein
MNLFSQRNLAITAAVGFSGWGASLLIDAKVALAGYLVAWIAFGAVPIGALAVLLTSYLVRAGWTRDFHEPLTGAALLMPTVGVLFIPILLGAGTLYPWGSNGATLPAFKAAYLSQAFFALRAILYFAIWSALAIWATRAYGNAIAMTRAASAGLVVWTLTASWAGIDWLESVEPAFHSSIYGLLAIDFYLLAGFAFGIVALLLSSPRRRMGNAAYSAVLLSLLLLWAYMHAMQYIIIWAGNIPEEVIWYSTRLAGYWAIALWLLFLLQFGVPFFLLLSERIRSSSVWLLSLATATLGLRVLEAAILILPPLHIVNMTGMFSLLTALLAVGCSLMSSWQAIRLVSARRSSGIPAAIGPRQHP